MLLPLFMVETIWLVMAANEHMTPEWVAVASSLKEADRLLFERITQADWTCQDDDCAWIVPIHLDTGVDIAAGNDGASGWAIAPQEERYLYGADFAAFLAEMVRRHRDDHQS